ncbi:MAG: divergent polysaccharide deacetylase family protein [Negativicutes bacterium]|jgi:hypothetical protein
MITNRVKWIIGLIFAAMLCSWIILAAGGGSPESGSQDMAVKTQAVAPGKGKLAIIIDDCGYSGSIIEKFAQIDAPLTFSVLPYVLYSQTAIDSAKASGKQVMVHLPMQSPSEANVEKTTILSSMTDAEIEQTTQNAINATPGALGVNNHQGDSATTDIRIMQNVMRTIANNKMFFIDSMTTPASVGCKAAKAFGVATAENELFLDNRNSVPYIENQLRKAVKLAHNKTIIAIGHARVNTAQAISNMLSEIHQSGIELVFASQIVR